MNGIKTEMRRYCMFIIIMFHFAVANGDDSIPICPLQGEIKLLAVNEFAIAPNNIVIERSLDSIPIPKRIISNINIYDVPYSRKARYENWNRLWLNTGVLYGAGFAALAVLESLPEDATNWNRAELSRVSPFKRWVNHVSVGAHVDSDNPIFNYIMHPYGGAAYFMTARSQGFNFWGSTLYCFCISTFFWEYGIEAFMEIPSIQDLIITPVAGALLGECFYKLKRRIVNDGYTLWGSRFVGNVVAFLIDPVNEFVGLFAGNACRQRLKAKRKIDIAFSPIIDPSSRTSMYGFALNVTF